MERGLPREVSSDTKTRILETTVLWSREESSDAGYVGFLTPEPVMGRRILKPTKVIVIH